MVREYDITGAVRALRAVRLACGVQNALAGPLLIASLAVVPALFFILVTQPELAKEIRHSKLLQILGLVFALLVAGFVVAIPISAFGLRGMRPIAGLASIAFALISGAFVVLEGLANTGVAAGRPQSSQSILYLSVISLGWAAIFLPTPWAYIRYMLLSRELRAMARPFPRVHSLFEVWAETFGVWRGYHRAWWSTTLSNALMTLAATFHTVGAWTLLSVLLFIPQAIILIPALLPQVGGELPPYSFLLAAAGAILLMAIAAAPLSFAALLRKGARYVTRQSFEAQVLTDQRAPTLFLRSFMDDQVTLPRVHPITALLAGESCSRRLDHILVEEFSRYAPIVALGKPGDKDLPFGAARRYVENESWQRTVQDLAQQAAFTVLVADPSPGVVWEIQEMLADAYRERVLIVCAPQQGDLDAVEALSFWRAHAGLHQSTSALLGAFTNLDGDVVALRAKGAIRPETYQIVLQAFFRTRTATL